MTFPILGGNSVSAEAYSIDNSVRLDNSDNSKLTQTVPSTATSTKIMTWNLWFKRCLLEDIQLFCSSRLNGSNLLDFRFHSDDALIIQDYTSGNNMLLWTNRKFRDVSAWYNVHIVIDTTDATADDRTKIYINGVQETSFASRTNYSLNADVYRWNTSGVTRGIGYETDTLAEYYDGYMSEFHFIDGQALSPTDFGEFDTDSGIWKPIEYTGSYGNNGFYLDFETYGSLGTDSSGNGNNFTVTSIPDANQVTDTPTNNFATFNAVFRNNTTNFTQPATLSEGNTRARGVNTEGNISTFGLNSGKWYWEVQIKTRVSNDLNFNILSIAGGGGAVFRSVTWQSQGDLYIDDSLYDTSFTTFSSGDIIACALDLDASTPAFKLYKNGAEQGSGFTFNASGRDDNGASIFIGVGIENTSDDARINFGNPRYNIISGNSDDNGYGNFEYAPPSGFLALCTQNLATALSPTIDDGSQYFSSTLYTGDGTSSRSITGLGFQPDWVWIKKRNSTSDHHLYDSSRGVDLRLETNSSDAELDNTTTAFESFDSDGFTLGSNSGTNGNTDTFVSWNWTASGSGTTSSNTDGSITSTVQANTTAGFSIVTYTGTGSNATVGHGLGVAPKMIICKQRNNTVAHDWIVYHESIGNTDVLQLNQDYAKGTYSVVWNNTSPTSSVFSVGTAGSVNESGKNQLAYCFAEIEGYSKFGSYTGNGSTDGPFIYTGFRPAFVIKKRTDTLGNWHTEDSTRNPYNVCNLTLLPNTSAAEESTSSYDIDILSNGFKIRANNGYTNASGGSYIYIAFAENPFASSSGVPVVAR